MGIFFSLSFGVSCLGLKKRSSCVSGSLPQCGSLTLSVWMGFCTVAFAISYNHEYSQFIHECTIAVMNTALSWMRQLIHEGQVGYPQLLYMMLTTKTGLSYTSTIGTGIETRLGLSYKAQQKGLRTWQCQRRRGRRKCRTKGGMIKGVGLGGGLYLRFCVTSLKPPALSRLWSSWLRPGCQPQVFYLLCVLNRGLLPS